MNNSIIKRLSTLIEDAEKVDNDVWGERWALQVIAFLKSTGLTDECNEFKSLHSQEFWDSHYLRIGYLQGILALAEAKYSSQHLTDATSEDSSNPSSVKKQDPRKVFIVHGHDNEAKETAARFIERLGLQPVILHEQANAGRTIIEKFETYSGDIAFAVVLLTPDDVGSNASDASNLKPRARQNVIMELGYFMGGLGRRSVCALYKGGVELPSDIQGVLYIEMDSAGGWKSKIAQELVQAKLPINLEALLGG